MRRMIEAILWPIQALVALLHTPVAQFIFKGMLHDVSEYRNAHIRRRNIALVIGLVSAIVAFMLMKQGMSTEILIASVVIYILGTAAHAPTMDDESVTETLRITQVACVTFLLGLGLGALLSTLI